MVLMVLLTVVLVALGWLADWQDLCAGLLWLSKGGIVVQVAPVRMHRSQLSPWRGERSQRSLYVRHLSQADRRDCRNRRITRFFLPFFFSLVLGTTEGVARLLETTNRT